MLPSGKRLHKTMETHNFSWENSLYMVTSHSYVGLPEGKSH